MYSRISRRLAGIPAPSGEKGVILYLGLAVTVVLALSFWAIAGVSGAQQAGGIEGAEVTVEQGGQIGSDDILRIEGDYEVAADASVTLEDSDGSAGTFTNGQNAQFSVEDGALVIDVTEPPTAEGGGEDNVLNADGITVRAASGVEAAGAGDDQYATDTTGDTTTDTTSTTPETTAMETTEDTEAMNETTGMDTTMPETTDMEDTGGEETTVMETTPEPPDTNEGSEDEGVAGGGSGDDAGGSDPGDNPPDPDNFATEEGGEAPQTENNTLPDTGGPALLALLPAALLFLGAAFGVATIRRRDCAEEGSEGGSSGSER